ncbi:hypothetical protein Fmac_016556 [Flemingia macrophylla]|uniref:Uncharacterized protein n=1 Tax=Flemingia macrophylla TaxID=520843 RepID=A0ABD1MIJ6_9FABA
MEHESARNYSMAVAPIGAGFKNVPSPIPYLFGGLALMLALVGLALVILACSYSKSSSSTSKATRERMEVDSEPKIVVIMAGDSNPTYMAKPMPSTNHAGEAD